MRIGYIYFTFHIPSNKLAHAIGFRFNPFLIRIYHYDEIFSINMPNGDSLFYLSPGFVNIYHQIMLSE